jgi:hypothetical protein
MLISYTSRDKGNYVTTDLDYYPYSAHIVGKTAGKSCFQLYKMDLTIV